MMKILKPAARIAALAAASLAGVAAMSTSAQAQVWFELRRWSAPEYFEEAPPRVYREARPRYVTPDIMPRRAVRRIVEGAGYEVIGPIQFNGDIYVVPVEDMRGRVGRLMVDARDGGIINRFGGDGPPRPPANVGRGYERDRYAGLPDASRLRPLPPEPRETWRMEEDYTGPVPPPPAPKAIERKPSEKARPAPPRSTNARPAKPAPKQEAAKPPSATVEKPRDETAKAAPPAAAPQGAAPATKAPKKRNASILRRPAQTDESKQAQRTTGEGVAAAPNGSTGAEPQRKSPRVVYPGPGAPAPEQPSTPPAE